MKTLIISLLITHIATGVIALLIGLVPMYSKKGSRLHNRAGLIYVYCMIAVAVSALLLCVLQPFKMMRLFLTGIAIFSFYLSMTGWRATKQKKFGPQQTDKILTYLTLAVSVLMVGFGVYLMASNGASFFSILFSFFGILTFTFAGRDIQAMNRPTEKMHWFFQHFTRMGGSYIATFTAALVTNNSRILPINAPEWMATLTWIAPSVIGGVLISRTVRYYKQKFGGTQTPVKA
ncbi:DUF2306 domain-containing protein [Spirosoma jeollabukense]